MSDATPPEVWLTRRSFLRGLGLAGLMATAPSCWAGEPGDPPQEVDEEKVRATIPKAKPPFPSRRNPGFAVPDREVTPELISASYNNFYELGTDKRDPHRNASLLRTDPWSLEVTGLCAQPLKLDLDALARRFPLEERVYRFRCVEAWAATVPWTGFALSELLRAAEPKMEARHVRFVSVLQPDLPGISGLTHYRWPYYEGLTLAEATAPLTLLTLGCYGHALPAQHGAPVRVIVPWKYGYKSPKSVVRIELVAERPRTFWNDAVPAEYGFTSNVDPKVPHPRWSQATERLLGSGQSVPTRYLNGYEKEVGHLYA